MNSSQICSPYHSQKGGQSQPLLSSWTPRVNSHSTSRTTLLSPLGWTVAKSAPLTTHRKVANHSHQNKTHLPEINKPQARRSRVKISIVLSNRFKHLHRGHYTHDKTPARHGLLGQFKNNLVLGSHCTGLYGRSMESAWGCSFSWTPSRLGAELSSRVKGV
jgi:hypothetical protein